MEPTALSVALAWVQAHPDLAHPPDLEAAVAIPFVRTEIIRPAALQAWRDRITQIDVVDVAFLGAGPANAALALALHRARPDLALAVIDRDVPGGPFARVGAAFRLNTWSAPGAAGMSLRDEVDLHGGLVVSPSQVSSARFPTGDTLADAALLTWLAIPAAVIAGDVRAIREDGGRVALVLGDERVVPSDERVPTGQRVVRANAAIVGTGFGVEPAYTFDAAGIALVHAEASRPVDQRRVFDVETMLGRVADVGVSALDAGDGELAVIGSGPSALAILALATGLGPVEVTDHAGRDSRRERRPRITWITGTHGPASAHAARDRRAEHAQMDYVITEGSATLMHELAHLEAIGRLRVVPGRVDTIEDAGARIRLVAGETSIEADRVVVCTGYRPRVAELFGAPSLASLIASGSASPLLVDGEHIAITLCAGRVHVVGAAIEEALTPDASRPPFAEAVVRAQVIANRLAQSVNTSSANASSANASSANASSANASSANASSANARARMSSPRPWDRMLAPLDLLLALAPYRFEGSRIFVRIDARGTLECETSDARGSTRALDAETLVQIERRLPARLVACAARHGLALSVDIDGDGRVVPVSAR